MKYIFPAILMLGVGVSLAVAQEHGAVILLKKTKKPTPATSKNAVLAFSDPDKPVKVAVNQVFSINLVSNPTTGYRWQLAKPVDEKWVKVWASYYQAPDTKLVGAAGKEIWTFKAVNPGETAISLNYLRPWKKNEPPEKAVTFRIIVN